MISTILMAVAGIIGAFLAVEGIRQALSWQDRHPALAAIGVAAVTMLVSAIVASQSHVLEQGAEFDPNAVSFTPPAPTPFMESIGRLQGLMLMGVGLLLLLSGPLRARLLTSIPLAYAFFWLCDTALPAVASSKDGFGRAYLYTLIIGLVFSTLPRLSLPVFVRFFRDAGLALMVASLLFWAVFPDLAADASYDSGLVGKFPRFAGLTLHPNVLGAVASPWLLCVAHQPYSRRWVQWSAVGAVLIALLASQSKTSLIGCLLASIVLWFLGSQPARRLPVGQWGQGSSTAIGESGSERNPLAGGRDPMQPLSRRGMAIDVPPPSRAGRIFLAFIALLALMAGALLFVAFAPPGMFTFSSSTVESVTSATGRTQIWELVTRAWEQSPWFGVGPDLFSSGMFAGYPEMAHVPHAHNQYVDVLGRGGIIGVTGFIVMLMAIGIRWRTLPAHWRPLAWSLVVLMIIQAFSEVPILSAMISMSSWSFWLLLAITAAAGRPDDVADSVNVDASQVRAMRLPTPPQLPAQGSSFHG